METLSFASSYGTPVEIDACWSCQTIWFDNFESVALSPQSVIDLFRRIHEARDQPRRTLSMHFNCPRCDSSLANTRDMVKAGHFSYYRCPHGDGRLISFTQFLLEKNFVRELNPAELISLATKVRQIRCSSCGAPIDLQNDTACTHCGSPISVLDDQAVEKALMDYEERAAHRTPIAQQPIAGGYRPAPQPVSSGSWSSNDVVNGIVAAEAGADLVDLVCVGIASLFD